MKKILFSIIIGSAFTVYAQETTVSDALRYGIQNLNGTARYRAMGGAFGAIGGDLSAININPAGSSIFNYNQATISLTSFNKRNNSKHSRNHPKNFAAAENCSTCYCGSNRSCCISARLNSRYYEWRIWITVG